MDLIRMKFTRKYSGHIGLSFPIKLAHLVLDVYGIGPFLVTGIYGLIRI